MRLHFHTVVPSAISLIGWVSTLSAPASAGEADPASAVRGSLGFSVDELASTGVGAAVFLLNAGFALLFLAVAIAAQRRSPRVWGHIPFRPTSYFPR